MLFTPFARKAQTKVFVVQVFDDEVKWKFNARNNWFAPGIQFTKSSSIDAYSAVSIHPKAYFIIDNRFQVAFELWFSNQLSGTRIDTMGSVRNKKRTVALAKMYKSFRGGNLMTNVKDIRGKAKIVFTVGIELEQECWHLRSNELNIKKV